MRILPGEANSWFGIVFPFGEKGWIKNMKTCFYCGRELAPGQRCTCRGKAGSASGGGRETSTAANTSSSYSASSSSAETFSSGASADPDTRKSDKEAAKAEKKAEKAAKKTQKKEKQVWNQDKQPRFTFATFITQVRSTFPSMSKLLRPVMSYIWHPVSTIENRPAVVPINKVIIVNTLFATLTSLMVLFTTFTDSPFLGMLISLIFGKTDLFSAHPVTAFFVLSAMLWLSVLILSLCFTLTSRLVNRRMTFLRALDTVTISSIYMCFADVLIFLSVLFGTRGAFTLIFVALVIMGICHFVSIRHDLAIKDDSAFNMLTISYLMFYVLAQLGINILIRIFVLLN